MPTGKLAPIETDSILSTDKSLKIMSGSDGARVIGGTALISNLQVAVISIREDSTAFTTLVCTNGLSSTTPLGVTFFLGGASTFLKGDMLSGPPGYWFTSIKPSAGSIAVTGPNVTGS
jgi:hypothetical protein